MKNRENNGCKKCKIIGEQKYKGNDQCKNKRKKSRDNPALTPLLSSLDSVASAGSTSAFSPAVSLSRWYWLCFYLHCLCPHLRHVSLAISLALALPVLLFSWPSTTIFWYVSDNDPRSHRQFPAKGHLRFLQILWLPHHSWVQWGNIWNFSRVLSKCTIIVSFVNWKKRENPVPLPRWSLGPFSTTLLVCPSPS